MKGASASRHGSAFVSRFPPRPRITSRGACMRFSMFLAVVGCLAPVHAAAAGSGWSDVLKVKAGTEVVITAAGSPPVHRYLVAGNEAGVTVLNAAHPAIPDGAASRLRDL